MVDLLFAVMAKFLRAILAGGFRRCRNDVRYVERVLNSEIGLAMPTIELTAVLTLIFKASEPWSAGGYKGSRSALAV